MVDAIGNKAGAVSDRRIAPVAPVSGLVPAASTAERTVVETSASELIGTMAASPTVDAERVAQIRKAIEEGRFALDPSTVADRLLTLKNEWTSK